eukprot:3184376-Pleurochrysis_carterae.AAC.1
MFHTVRVPMLANRRILLTQTDAPSSESRAAGRRASPCRRECSESPARRPWQRALKGTAVMAANANVVAETVARARVVA